ncbi:MAG: nucleotidyltransferase family protein [Candidatus Asgardarchaeia archaeon]
MLTKDLGRTTNLKENTLETIIKEIENTQIILVAGGKGKRMGMPDIPKPLIKIHDKTLLDLSIEFYKQAGFKDFILLIGHLHKMIERHIEEKGYYDVNIKVSVDPEEQMMKGIVGKGKALKYAIRSNIINKNKRAIITYPDDVFLDRFLPINLLTRHIYGVEKMKIWATLVLVPGTTYPFGVARLNYDGLINSFEEKPFIQKDTYTGTCMIEPEVYNVVDELVDLDADKPIDFEGVVIPELAKRHKLYSYHIAPNTWLPINTQKEYEAVLKLFEKEKWNN